MKQRGIIRHTAGFTFGEMLCIAGILSVLVLMVLSGLSKARARVSRITCIVNIKQINLAFRQWSLDHGDQFPTQVAVTNGGAMEWERSGEVWRIFQVMSNELNAPQVLWCTGENDPRRIRATNFSASSSGAFANNSNVSFFVNLDARLEEGGVILLGDACLVAKGISVPAGLLPVNTQAQLGWQRPLRRDHERGGNLGMADGSAAQVSDETLNALAQQNASNDVIWAIP